MSWITGVPLIEPRNWCQRANRLGKLDIHRRYSGTLYRYLLMVISGCVTLQVSRNIAICMPILTLLRRNLRYSGSPA